LVESSVSPVHSYVRQQPQLHNWSTSLVVPVTHVFGGGPEAVRRAFLDGTLVPDPRCPLTDRQLYGLAKSWKAINRDMSITAMNMFVRYV